MSHFPLRTKFLAWLLCGVLAVNLTTLLVVSHAVESQIRTQIRDDLRNSILTFKTFQKQREATLSHAVELLADLPTVKALMTTHDVATIQDASDRTFYLSGSDLLVLATPAGNVMAVHASSGGMDPAAVQEPIASSIRAGETRVWWFLKGHLYEVFLQPIFFGGSRDNRALGVLALGYEIDEHLANDVSSIAGSQVAFLYGDAVVATTISLERRSEFVHQLRASPAEARSSPGDLLLGGERYLSASVALAPGMTPGVRLSVLKSYDEANARFSNLYRILAGLGLFALLGQSLLAFAIFGRYTRPLEELVAGVRALGKGDFSYTLKVRGEDELADATASFIRMRNDLQEAQAKLLQSERLATIGTMASSISHDLRHQLTSVVANAEFMSEANLPAEQVEELHQEIRDAVNRMTELIDSLLEFSKGRDALSPSYGSIQEIMRNAMRSVQKHPSVQNVAINLTCEGSCEGWFDSRKMERAFYNLLLNACQSAGQQRVEGRVNVRVQDLGQSAEIHVCDNGPGIPEHLQQRVFEPFFSYAKEHGTGLGLTIVQKILEEHGGSITLESGNPGETSFRMIVPLRSGADAETADAIVPAGTDHSRLIK